MKIKKHASPAIKLIFRTTQPNDCAILYSMVGIDDSDLGTCDVSFLEELADHSVRCAEIYAEKDMRREANACLDCALDMYKTLREKFDNDKTRIVSSAADKIYARVSREQKRIEARMAEYRRDE